jgi:hypothetical protein
MKPIRCGNDRPTPYLRKHLPGILPHGIRSSAVDLGAGNLRNTRFARSLGWRVLPLDAAGDHGSLKVDLAREDIPCGDSSVDLFLCNYLLCFMTEVQRLRLLAEIDRTARPGAHIVVEMFNAKKGFPYDTGKIAKQLGWEILRMSKDRFIARRAV